MPRGVGDGSGFGVGDGLGSDGFVGDGTGFGVGVGIGVGVGVGVALDVSTLRTVDIVSTDNEATAPTKTKINAIETVNALTGFNRICFNIKNLHGE